METESAIQEQVSERQKNAPAFRTAYGKLNHQEQMKEQKAFCNQYDISPPSFRGRLAGTHRVSDTELAWFEKRVATYFKD